MAMGKSSNKENVSPNQVARLPKNSKKRKVPSGLQSSGSSKKARQQVTLLTLPYDVQELLLQYLDVVSMDHLAKTSSYFDSLIHGKYFTTVHLPFRSNGAFMTELKEAKTIEKKPLLRIERRKPKSYSYRYYENDKQLVDFQMDLLSLQNVREVEMGPQRGVTKVDSNTANYWESCVSVDRVILTKLSRLGSLRNISRLDLTIPGKSYAKYLWKEVIPAMNLVNLRLSVVVGSGSSSRSLYGYLEELISTTRAVKVSLRVYTTSKTVSKVPKLFKNDCIESLYVSAPCGFDLHLQMKKLKKVRVELSGTGQSSCSYPGSRISDRQLHRPGLCVLHLGSLHGSSPQLTTFNGIHLNHMSESFAEWNSEIKKIFYDDYILQGGEMELKRWTKARWFQKKPTAPAHYGKNRMNLPQILQYLDF